MGNWSRSRNIKPKVSAVLTALFITSLPTLFALSHPYPELPRMNLTRTTPDVPPSFHWAVRARSCASGRVVVTLRPMPPRMVLLRHGATKWSLSGQHTGRTDIPLLEVGCDQARAAGGLLRSMRFAQVRTSPLLRAVETCELAGYEGEPDPDLLEWDYGAYEGMTSAQI